MFHDVSCIDVRTLSWFVFRVCYPLELAAAKPVERHFRNSQPSDAERATESGQGSAIGGAVAGCGWWVSPKDTVAIRSPLKLFYRGVGRKKGS